MKITKRQLKKIIIESIGGKIVTVKMHGSNDFEIILEGGTSSIDTDRANIKKELLKLKSEGYDYVYDDLTEEQHTIEMFADMLDEILKLGETLPRDNEDLDPVDIFTLARQAEQLMQNQRGQDFSFDDFDMYDEEENSEENSDFDDEYI